MSAVFEKLKEVPGLNESAPTSQPLNSAGRRAPRSRVWVFGFLFLLVVLASSRLVYKKLTGTVASSSPQPLQQLVSAVDITPQIRSQLDQSHYSEVIKTLSARLKEKPDDVPGLIDLSLAQFKAGDLEAAREGLEKALELDPANPVALNNLGLCYAASKDFTRAIELYKKALAIRPDYPEALINSAASYEKTQQWQSAVEAYERYSQLAQSIGKPVDEKKPDKRAVLAERLRKLRALAAFARHRSRS